MSAPNKPGAGRRWLVWLPLLAVAGWLALFGDKSATSEAVSLPTRSGPPTPEPAQAALPVTRASSEQQGSNTLATLVSRAELITAETSASGPAASRDPFSARNWNPPPPPPPAPTPPPPPSAPPLPYAFIGKKLEGETWEIYLTRGDQTFVAREGEVLEGTYRVDKIQPPSLTMTYLPLGQVQSLSIGDTR